MSCNFSGVIIASPELLHTKVQSLVSVVSYLLILQGSLKSETSVTLKPVQEDAQGLLCKREGEPTCCSIINNHPHC